MTDNTASPAKSRFSFGTALSDTFGFVFGGFTNLVSLSWVLFALVCLIGALWIAAVFLSANVRSDVPLYIVGGLGILGVLASFFAYYIVIARNFLFGEQNPPVAGLFWPVVGRGFLLSLLIVACAVVLLLPAIIFAGIGAAIEYQKTGSAASSILFIASGVLALAGLVGLVYLIGRWSTWLISTIAERQQTLREAWRVTAGAGFRILAGLIVVGIAFGVIDLALETVLSLLLRLPGTFSEMLTASQSLVAVFIVLLGKIVVYFLQTAASAAYAGSVFRQTFR